jgi:addiction module HigA family antidote
MTRRPVHSGEILADELEAVGLSSAELARMLEVPANRISQILAGKRSITADTDFAQSALRIECRPRDEPPEDLRSRPCCQNARQGDQQNPAAPC